MYLQLFYSGKSKEGSVFQSSNLVVAQYPIKEIEKTYS